MTSPFSCTWRKTTTLAQTDGQLTICCPTLRTSTSPFVLPGRQNSIRTGPNKATSSCVWCQNYTLGGFYCSIVDGHTTRQDSWPNIQQRAAPTVCSWETRQNARFQGFNCRVSQYGLMFGKAHCKPYVWYAFSAMSVTWINCKAPGHSHLIHVRNSWL